jgi:hypothetical protein
MITFDTAHIREQGQDMTIVPIKSTFGRRPAADQSRTETALATAGRAGAGRMTFGSHRPWHP